MDQMKMDSFTLYETLLKHQPSINVTYGHCLKNAYVTLA